MIRYIAAVSAAVLAMSLFGCGGVNPVAGTEPESAAGEAADGEDKLTDFYLDIIDDLYNDDEGLNYDIDTIGLDLSEAYNLSDDEKQAVADGAGKAYDLNVVCGTSDDLADQGYIDRESLYFTNGVLISIEVDGNSVKDDAFTFDAEKWRGGDGAIFYDDCAASLGADGWGYTVGSFAIS